METMAKNEELKFIIDRYDHYYDSINNKGNLYLTLNTFILGGVIAGFFTLNSQYHFCPFIVVLFILTLIFNLFSIGLTLLAIKPYSKGEKKANNNSLVFFRDVSDMTDSQYNALWSDMDEIKYHGDLKRQAQILANGLKRKFSFLSSATWFIIGQVFFIILFGILLLNI
jgi:hypothetical protein